MNLASYLKAAFLNRWNLLALFGASGFAVLSGYPDFFLPLVAAGEIAYVGLLGTRPRFQQAIDAQLAKASREQVSAGSQETFDRIVKALPRELLNRFESLRTQCVELQQIARQLRSAGSAVGDLPLEDFQVAGLDRLLWIYLRLLYTQFALTRFFRKTSEDEIRRDIAQLESRLQAATPPQAETQAERVYKSLQDHLATSRDRLANLVKARGNYELVELEIDRLENKIRSLSEMAVNRQEPEFISGQVDQVASSMLETEKTMNELQFVTGLEAPDAEPPPLLRTTRVTARP